MSVKYKISIFGAFLLLAAAVGNAAYAANAPFTLNSNHIIDQSGRELIVTTPFKRIISLYGAHTENLFFMGAGPQVVGVLPHTSYPPAAQERPAFHYRDGAERFLAARPDLVLIRPMIARGYPRLVEKLEASGMVVVSLQPGNVDEMHLYWRILGVLTGHEKEAEAMVREFQERVAAFRAVSRKIEPKKGVYFEAIHSRMKTFSPASMAVFALECAGGINLAADAVPLRKSNIAEFGKERLLVLGDRVDVYLAQVGPMNRPSVASICAEPGFQVIRAVRGGQVYLVDETLVSRPTMRLLEGMAAIGHILYPDRFDAPAEARSSAGGKGDHGS